MTTTWPRVYALRGPTGRNIFLFCVFLALVNHFRTWNLNYPYKPTSLVPAPAPIPPVLEIPKTAQEPLQPPPPPPTPTPTPTPTPPEPTVIPKKIWYKLGPKGLSDDARGWTNTCITQNPEYEVKFLTDQSADVFVKENFADRPDILDVYLALTVPILKADLLRYLLLYTEGGVWFDLDVSCEGIPIDDWTPPEYKKDASLVVGWEFDGGYHFEFDRQFTTWTVLAKKGVPHLMAVVEDIIQSMYDAAEAHNVTIAGLKVDMIGDVVDFTGPKRFEKSVVKSIERTFDKTDGWEAYHEILEPKMAGDVLILPGYALCKSYNTYEPEDQDRIGATLVTHHYAGTWKNNFGGEEAEEHGEKP